jgi:hypothetical protein
MARRDAAAATAAVVIVMLLLPDPSNANRTFHGRELLQSGVSCSAEIPACTARRCTTRVMDSKETYVCLRCMTGKISILGVPQPGHDPSYAQIVLIVTSVLASK